MRGLNNINFGQALEALKDGKKVARVGWNGKGVFLYLVKGTQVKSSNLRNEALDHVGYMGEGDTVVTFNAHIDMKAADGTVVVGWLASQTDMLADDWMIIE